MNTASLDPANRATATRRIDFRPGMDMWWEILRNGEDTDGEFLEANSWLGPHSPSPPVHVHDNAEDSFEIVEGRLDVKLDGSWRTLARLALAKPRCSAIAEAALGRAARGVCGHLHS